MELKDRELALRWWNRKTSNQKLEVIKESEFDLYNRPLTSLTGYEIQWIWKNQPYNK